MTTVLVTGIAGFIGSHTVEHLQEATDWRIVGLASFRHSGDPLRLDSFDFGRTEIHRCDLTAPISPRLADRIGPVDYIINMAAESHVDRSIIDPRPFIENNVSLAITMLDYARVVRPKAFIQISTDEVYGSAPPGTFHKEWSTLLPSNPYSASKAAQEAIAISYWRTFGVPVIITNTMNNFGERQDTEKFVPKVIKNVYNQESVTIHGREGYIGSRFYLHARNHADALLFILQNVIPEPYSEDGADRPSRFNIVGEREINNLDLAHMIADVMKKPLIYGLEDFHAQRPGHDRRYALDGKKIADLGWSPPLPLEESLERTINWTLKNTEWLK